MKTRIYLQNFNKKDELNCYLTMSVFVPDNKSVEVMEFE